MAKVDHNRVMTFRSLFLCCLCFPSLSWAWGFDGHRRLSSLMQDALPENHCLRSWFSARQTSTLQNRSCDPDRWRDTDPEEGPRHFLEIDWVTPLSAYPRDYVGAVQVLGPRNAQNNGQVPWRVEQKYQELVVAFRSQDPVAILDAAFILSHYVFDAASVLHNTKNFNPNNGLHLRWESDMLNVSANINGITQLAQSRYGVAGRVNPRELIFDLVEVGNGLVPQLIEADIASAGSTSQLYALTRNLTARRWGDAVTVMSSLMWTAWVDAGSPELPGFSSRCSRAAPNAELTLVGYPLAPRDAGSVDAGLSERDGGVVETEAEDGGMLDAEVPWPTAAPSGCACSEFPLEASLGFLLLHWRRRTRGG